MRDELLFNARRLFAELRDCFEQRNGASGWFVEFEREELEAMGMNPRQYRAAVEHLERRGLVKHVGMDAITLDDLGCDACLHPEVLDSVLGPAVTHAPGTIHVTAEHVVIGNNNSVQINTTVLIQNIVDHLKADTTVDEPTKKRWIDALKDVGSHLTATAAKVVLDKILGQ